MPFTGSESILGALIRSEIDSEFPIGERDVDPDDRQKACDAIARALITHLTTQTLTVFGIAPPTGGPITGGKLV